jgi:hypothetical protein
MCVVQRNGDVVAMPSWNLSHFSADGGSYTRTRTLEKVMMPAIDTDAVRILCADASALRHDAG